jgi:molybdate transport system ATP-binding protein
VSLLADVRVRQGSFALDVALTAAEGELVAVIGPNGAGKSTLLWTLAGLRPVDEGRIVLNGEVLDDSAAGVYVPPEKRAVGVVFQDNLLFPHLTALDNVAFGLRQHGRDRRTARAEARRWLGLVGLADLADRKPRQLSGGQAQRVALVRALATAPRLLLLDEPLSALDVRTRVEVRRDLRRMLDSFPGVRLIVTHDPTEALTLADRLIIIENGRVTQSATPAEVTARPRSPYIAQFVGVNLLRGWADGSRVVLDGGIDLAVPNAGTGEAFAVIHPRAVSLHTRAPHGSPRNVWQARVHSMDIERDVVRVALVGKPALVAEVTATAVKQLELVPDRAVWASVKATEITVYPV